MSVLNAAKYAALFLSEAREHLAAIDEALLALEQGASAPRPDAMGAPLATAFRGVHTIKGMAGAMGYQAVEQLAHALESHADPMRRAGHAPGAEALQRLFDGTELLRAAIDAVPSGQVEPTHAMQAFLRGLSAAPEAEPAAATPEAVALERVAPDAVTPDPGAPRTIRLDARRLDTLLDLVGELVITRDRLLRALEASEHPDRAVVRAAHDAARLVATLQDEVLQARMLPAAQVFDRFPRLVRDLARELGKEVHFTMAGRDLEIDRSVLDAIGEPIMHLLRNALDHGLEDAATRLAAGKPAAGVLTLRAARDRAALVIQVRDDGRGIDRDAVRQRAQEQGLVGAAAATLTDDALLPLVAHPGLSTARAVTALSGRGVGVDVVNTRVRALGGRLELATAAGEGTLFTMRLPLTLAIMRALLVQVGGATYAIPAAHVREVLEFTGASRGTGALTITVRDEIIPLVALQQRFEDDPLAPAAAPVDGARHVAVVDVAGRRTALLVDALLAQQDIVVKPLETVRGARPWFSGATILGDGSPALIVDVSSVA
ncbi:MAG: chemotaxis protein CheA [Gemmatimonadota bacterium]|nr:chemotaxis protein CheA [Gemmatimonadota bacterium]